MSQIDPVVFRELPVIQQIIRDETWLEGERRGCNVSANDPAVRENVCHVILRIGVQLRESLTAQVTLGPGPTRVTPLPAQLHSPPARIVRSRLPFVRYRTIAESRRTVGMMHPGHGAA